MRHEAIDAVAGDGRPAIRTNIIDRRTYDRHIAHCRMLLAILAIAERSVLDRPELLDLALHGYPHADVVRAGLDYAREPVGRFDTLIDEQGVPRFIEYNPGLCGGAFIGQNLAEHDLAARRLSDPANAAHMRCVPTGELFMDSIWAGSLTAMGRPPRELALIVPAAPSTAGDAVDQEIAAFVAGHAARGGRIWVGMAHEISARENRLQLRDTVVDAMIVMDWEATLAECPAGHPLRAPAAFPETWIANDFGAAVMRGGKHLFALISDPASGIAFDSVQRRWIARHVPWTRMVPARSGTPTERDRAMIADIHRNREELVLKPSIGRGGHGIVAGWTVDDAHWREAVGRAGDLPHIVQARVRPQTEADFWEIERTGTATRFIADRCAFVWQDGSIDGIIARAGVSWLLNISAGFARPVATLIEG